jgi:hypothetical protein
LLQCAFAFAIVNFSVVALPEAMKRRKTQQGKQESRNRGRWNPFVGPCVERKTTLLLSGLTEAARLHPLLEVPTFEDIDICEAGASKVICDPVALAAGDHRDQRFFRRFFQQQVTGAVVNRKQAVPAHNESVASRDRLARLPPKGVPKLGELDSERSLVEELLLASRQDQARERASSRIGLAGEIRVAEILTSAWRPGYSG